MPSAATLHAAVLCAGISEFMAEDYLNRWYPLGPDGNRTGILEVLQVPCVPLAYVLDAAGMHAFDFWSLDVEGAELEVRARKAGAAKMDASAVGGEV